MLPQELVGVYNFFACGNVNYGCPSVTGIDIGGVHETVTGDPEDYEMNEQQTAFVYKLCKDMEETVEEILIERGTSAPSISPGVVPTSTMPPTPAAVVSTSSPTVLNGTANEECPEEFKANYAYEAGETVINPLNDVSSTNNNNGYAVLAYYQCKEFPYTAWCAQEAYEPGVGMAWEEAWTLMGDCVLDTSSTTTTTTTTTTTKTTVATTIATTEMTSQTTEVPPESSTTGATETTATTAAAVTTHSPTPSVPKPTKLPTTIDPNDPPFTGTLPIEFQYEIGNTNGIDAHSISTGMNPINDMERYLLEGTTMVVEEVILNAFGDPHFGAGGGGGRVRGDVAGIRRRERIRGRRSLQVVYAPGTVGINDIEDIGEW